MKYEIGSKVQIRGVVICVRRYAKDLNLCDRLDISISPGFSYGAVLRSMNISSSRWFKPGDKVYILGKVDEYDPLTGMYTLKLYSGDIWMGIYEDLLFPVAYEGSHNESIIVDYSWFNDETLDHMKDFLEDE